MCKQNCKANSAAGFSLMELIIAMTITLVVMGIASTLLARSFNVRKREDQRTDALADAQRSLNTMTHEIASTGFNLTGNGIVDADSQVDANGNGTIRVRANLNKFDSTVSQAARDGIGVATEDAGEDVKYFVVPTADTSYLARYDRYGGAATVLANRIDSFHVQYYDERVTYTTGTCAAPISNAQNKSGTAKAQVSPSQAKYLVLAICVDLAAVGTPSSPGYQPASRVLLVSDVALRNAVGVKY
ncbi:MAG: prepilin-type N-terminal cleavage/methylation domain-containing protein [Acidobacteria bacterium]|nr:prepilin-type N-terminal cleavage/methylation domain-containing protein [Acidobacteriota bacterium]